jgi:Zn-finger nucleic acid-binding protein
MDLSGRSSSDAYRGAAVRCPACGEPMRRDATASAELEVCDACEGLWVDWFDGEVHTVAVEAEAARVERGTPLPSRPGERSTGTGVCPRCSRPLVSELYRFGDARDDELITGVELLRCAECAGAFVPRGSAHLLLDRAQEARTQTLWEALRAFFARWRPRARAARDAS